LSYLVKFGRAKPFVVHYNLLYRWKERQQMEGEESAEVDYPSAEEHEATPDSTTYIDLPGFEDTSVPALPSASPEVQMQNDSSRDAIDDPEAPNAEDVAQDATSKPVITRTRVVKPPGWLKDFVT
jgi:hypothetical protein